MTDHSPDHAERAVIVAWLRARADECHSEERNEGRNAAARHDQAVAAIALDAAANEIALGLPAALRGRDRVVEDLTTALHDAISRPAGVVPASAEPFYDWRRYDRGPVIREIAK